MNVKQEDGIGDLKRATMELVKAQRLAIEAGTLNAKQAAHSKLVIEGEITDV